MSLLPLISSPKVLISLVKKPYGFSSHLSNISRCYLFDPTSLFLIALRAVLPSFLKATPHVDFRCIYCVTQECDLKKCHNISMILDAEEAHLVLVFLSVFSFSDGKRCTIWQQLPVATAAHSDGAVPADRGTVLAVQRPSHAAWAPRFPAVSPYECCKVPVSASLSAILTPHGRAEGLS